MLHDGSLNSREDGKNGSGRLGNGSISLSSACRFQQVNANRRGVHTEMTRAGMNGEIHRADDSVEERSMKIRVAVGKDHLGHIVNGSLSECYGDLIRMAWIGVGSKPNFCNNVYFGQELHWLIGFYAGREVAQYFFSLNRIR